MQVPAFRRMATQPVARHIDASALQVAFTAGTNDRSIAPPGAASRRRM